MEGGFAWYLGADVYNNWDLNAVVRLGCRGDGALAPPPYPYGDPFFLLPTPPPQQDILPNAANVWQRQAMDMPAVAEPAANMWQQEAMDVPVVSDEDFLAQVFFPVHEQPPPPAASSANEVVPQQGAADNSPPVLDKPQSSSKAGGSSRPRQKRRVGKNTEATTVTKNVPAVNLPSADPWSWRKYGAKPIKGFPNPRNYYKCSSDKACPARRVVECCNNDKSFLIITYTGEHTHAQPRAKNVHAGTTRRNMRGKTAPPRRPNAEVAGGSGPSHQAPPPPPAVPAQLAAVVYPPAPVRSQYPNEFEAEEDDDAIAVKFLIDDAVMAPENAFLFHGGPLAPVLNNGGGGAPVPNVVMDAHFVPAWGSSARRQGM